MLPILTRGLGLAAYGTWTQISTAVSLFVTVAMLALPDAFSRFSAALTDRKAIAENYYTMLATVALGAIVLGLGLFEMSEWMAETFVKGQSDVGGILRVGAALLATQAVAQFATTFFSTFQREQLFAFFQFFQGGVTLVVVVVAVYLGGDLLVVLWAFVAMHAVRFVIAQVLVSRQIGFKPPHPQLLKGFLIYSLPLLPLGLLNWVISLSDRYVIGYYLPVEEVGRYSACYSLAMMLQFIYAPFFVFLLPKLSQLWERGEMDSLRQVLHFSNKLPLLIALPFAFGLGVLQGPLLELVAGQPVHVPRLMMATVAGGLILFYVGIFYAQVFALVKRTHLMTAGHGIGAGVNIVGNLLAVPFLGIAGAAFATMATFALQTAFFIWRSRGFRDSGIRWGFLWKAVAASVISTTILSAVVGTELLTPPYRILLACAGGAASYIGICLLLRILSRDEINILLRTVRHTSDSTSRPD